MKRICTRMLAGFTALLLMMTMMSGTMAEESELQDLEPVLLVLGENTAEDWWESYTSKTALAVCAYCDIVLSDNTEWEKISEEAVTTGKIYVAKSDQSLMIFFFGETELVIVFVTPALEQAWVLVTDLSASIAGLVMSSMQENGSFTVYTQIENDDFYTAFGALVDVINKE